MHAILPILLLPEHVTPTASNIPLLKAIQKVLNDSYTATYCTHPEIFGTSHLRMADPAQLADVIGADGFTIVLVRVTSDGADQQPQLCEVLATGSVKDFGEGDVETYAQWSKNRSGSEWETQVENRGRSDGTTELRAEVQKFEITAFAVSPHCQATGLGAQVLREIKWLVTSDANGPRLRNITAKNTALVHGLRLSGSATTIPLQGIDLNRQKDIITGVKITMPGEKIHDTAKSKLVLMAIRELGNEEYYQRRGFSTTWSGTVPVGMWDCRKECTMVYMEMDVD
jgi:ribosomal protein S18 acetylase RimI-like enzyme